MLSNTNHPGIKRRGKIYWASFMVNGRRIRESLKTTNFDTAKIRSNNLHKKVLLGENWREDKELIGDVWDEFIADKASGKMKGSLRNAAKVPRQRTIEEYVYYGRKYFLPFFENRRVSDISSEMWDEYIRNVKSEKPDLKIFSHWKCFSNFCRWLKQTGRLNSSRPISIYNPDKPDKDGSGRVYSESELKLLRESSTYPPMTLWILMGQFMGMRCGEVTQLEKKCIDLKANVIRLRESDTKTAQRRIIPIHPKVRAPLIEQMNESKSPYLFPIAGGVDKPMSVQGFKKPWRKLRDDLGISGRFHDFRHTYATQVFKDPKVNPFIACSALGMSMETAQKVYIHFTAKDFDRLVESVDWT